MAQIQCKVVYLSPVQVNPGSSVLLPQFKAGFASSGCAVGDIMAIYVDPSWGNFQAAVNAAVSIPGAQVVVASTTPVLQAAKASGTGLPIVGVGVSDEALLHGANVTGVHGLRVADVGLLLDRIRGMTPVGVVFNANNPSKQAQFNELRLHAGPARGVAIQDCGISSVAADIPARLNPACPAYVVLSDPLTIRGGPAILDAIHHLNAEDSCEGTEFKPRGKRGVGPDRPSAYRRAGQMACQICQTGQLPPVQGATLTTY